MIECTNFTSHQHGCLQGFADFLITKWGLEIKGCTLNMKDGKRWINLPSRPYESDGEKKYMPIVRFKDKEMTEKFSEMAKKAIEDYCSKQNKQQPFNDNKQETLF